MATIHFPAPPNPTSNDDAEWTTFDQYLARNGIRPVVDAALEAYQHSANGRFLCAQELNHCLTLESAGDAYGEYGNEDETPIEVHGSLDDFSDPTGRDFAFSKTCIDRLFAQDSIHVADETILYKGIGFADMYAYLELDRMNEGDVVTFFGFLSTSVCRENAERFAGAGILLVLSRIDRIPVLVPPNARVLNAPTGNVPEQELLLDRGQGFRVVKVVPSVPSTKGTVLRELHLEALIRPTS